MVFEKDPWEMMRKLNKNMEKLTRELWKTPRTSEMGFKKRPSMDVIDKGKEMVMKINMPGVSKEDISIRATEGMLEVAAERKEKEEVKEKDFYKKERRYTGYKRKFSLPKGAKPGEIEAEYEDGVLTITVPKKKEKKEKKKIKVK